MPRAGDHLLRCPVCGESIDNDPEHFPSRTKRVGDRATLAKMEEMLERSEAEWERAIVEWLGPQRMSVTRKRAVDDYALGAVIACSIIYAQTRREHT